MQKVILILLLLFTYMIVSAQEKNAPADSSIAFVLDKRLSLEERYHMLVKLEDVESYEKLIEGSLLLLDEAYALSDKKYILLSYRCLIDCQRLLSRSEDSSPYIDSILVYIKQIDDPGIIGTTYYKLGVHYEALYDYPTSYSYSYKAIPYLEKSPKDRHLISEIYYSLSMVYVRVRDEDNIKKMEEKLFEVASKYNDREALVKAYCIKAVYFGSLFNNNPSSKEMLDSMLFYEHRVIEIFETIEHPSYNLTTTVAYDYQNLAVMMLEADAPDRFEASLGYIEKARLQAPNDITIQLSYHDVRGNVFFDQGKLKQAEKEVQSQLDILSRIKKKTTQVEYREAYDLASKIEEAKGNYREALKYERLKNEYNKEIFDVEKYDAVEAVKTEYEISKREDEIEQLKEVNRYQQRVRNLYIGILALVGLSLVFLIWRYVTKRRADAAQLRVAELQKTEAELQSKLEKERAELLHAKVDEKENEYRALLKETELNQIRNYLKGLEAERSRLAKELHDGISNELLALKMKTEQGHSNTGDITRSLAYIHNTVRQVSHELLPPVFQYASLPEVLTDYCRRLNENGKTKLHTMIEPDADWSDFPQETALEIYRIIQETVGNALKHAQAKTIEIRLSRSYHQIEVQVEDDGKGMSNTLHEVKGIGLRIIRERVESLHGQFILDTRPGKGVKIQVIIPLSQA